MNSKTNMASKVASGLLAAALLGGVAPAAIVTVAAVPTDSAYAAEAGTYSITYDSKSAENLSDWNTTKEAGASYTILGEGLLYLDGARSQRPIFDANGGVFSDGSNVSEGAIYETASATLAHWDGSDGKTYKPGDVYSTDADLALTASWNPLVFVHEATCNAGEPTRDGYTFDGWFTEPEGGKRYVEVTDDYCEPSKLYAHWVAVAETGNQQDEQAQADAAAQAQAQAAAAAQAQAAAQAAQANSNKIVPTGDEGALIPAALLAAGLVGVSVSALRRRNNR